MGIALRVVRIKNMSNRSKRLSKGNLLHYPESLSLCLQAGSLHSGSVSHLNKHGPAEDGGEFVEA